MPSSFAVNLTGASYNGLNVLINVESAYRDKVIPNTNIVFVDGTRQAVSGAEIIHVLHVNVIGR